MEKLIFIRILFSSKWQILYALGLDIAFFSCKIKFECSSLHRMAYSSMGVNKVFFVTHKVCVTELTLRTESGGLAAGVNHPARSPLLLPGS